MLSNNIVPLQTSSLFNWAGVSISPNYFHVGTSGQFIKLQANSNAIY